MPHSQPVGDSKPVWVEDWLRSLGLINYAQSFYDNGYEDKETCQCIGDIDLDEIGVYDESTREMILSAVSRLKHNVAFQADEKCQIDIERTKLDPKKLQSKIQNILKRDKINLDEPPYFTRDKEFADLTPLSFRIADEIRTIADDVNEALVKIQEHKVRKISGKSPQIPRTTSSAPKPNHPDNSSSVKKESVAIRPNYADCFPGAKKEVEDSVKPPSQMQSSDVKPNYTDNFSSAKKGGVGAKINYADCFPGAGLGKPLPQIPPSEARSNYSDSSSSANKEGAGEKTNYADWFSGAGLGKPLPQIPSSEAFARVNCTSSIVANEGPEYTECLPLPITRGASLQTDRGHNTPLVEMGWYFALNLLDILLQFSITHREMHALFIVEDFTCFSVLNIVALGYI